MPTDGDREALLNRAESGEVNSPETNNNSNTDTNLTSSRSSVSAFIMRQWSRFWSLKRQPISLVLALITLCVVVSLVTFASDSVPPKKSSKIPEPVLIVAKNGAVSSENPLCSKAGVEILKEGGSAMDATIATSLCIGVTNMYSSGIGGGGFLLARSANGSIAEVIDFREEAPAAAFTDMYKDNPKKAQIGGLAVGVPGEIRGFEVAHKRFGRLPWERLFQYAIDISENGWAVTPTLAKRIAAYQNWVLTDPVARDIFAPEGVPLVEGQIIKRKRLAATLRKIAKGGAKAFYEGSIAEQLVKTTVAAGGILTMEDMKKYQAKLNNEVIKPLVGYYHGRKVITAPAPCSGAVLLSILNIIEGFNFPVEGRTPLNIHRLVEAFKYAYAQRAFYGDPIDPIYQNISTIEKIFLNKDISSHLRSNISSVTTFDPLHYQPKFDIKEDHGTMHVSVLTSEGDAVTLTSTVNLVFGAQLMDPETGIILNDEMDDFSIPGVPNAFGLAPSPYNYIHPRKRPLSSSVPTIIETNGEIEFISGASGGSRIITSTLQTLVNMMDFGMTLAEAVKDPRFHHQLLPNEVTVEYDFDGGLTKTLEEKGHKITRLPEGMTLTGVESIRRLPDGRIEDVSEPWESLTPSNEPAEIDDEDEEINRIVSDSEEGSIIIVNGSDDEEPKPEPAPPPCPTAKIPQILLTVDNLHISTLLPSILFADLLNPRPLLASIETLQSLVSDYKRRLLYVENLCTKEGLSEWWDEVKPCLQQSCWEPMLNTMTKIKDIEGERAMKQYIEELCEIEGAYGTIFISPTKLEEQQKKMVEHQREIRRIIAMAEEKSDEDELAVVQITPSAKTKKEKEATLASTYLRGGRYSLRNRKDLFESTELWQDPMDFEEFKIVDGSVDKEKASERDLEVADEELLQMAIKESLQTTSNIPKRRKVEEDNNDDGGTIMIDLT
ncbi:hypothetical protein HDV05_004555 [Chytridiales sp. JEL 0842]|nr:hypothetical protein HDV05_004555 [Chytridiales sp. JEL 0842]